jgi:glycogen debranching enzyme
MQEIDHESQDYYILATSTRADERTRVVKHGDSFGVFDPAGTIRRAGMGELGLYHDGTRFVSTFELALARRRPMLLGSTVRHDGVLVVDLANPDIPDFPGGALDRDTVHVSSTNCLWDGVWYARYSIHSFARRPIELDFVMMFAADFFDVFEVRGLRRPQRGTQHAPHVERHAVTLGYDGLDGHTRTSRFELAPAPWRVTGSRAEYALRLEPGESTQIDLSVAFGIDRAPAVLAFEGALERVLAEAALRHTHGARITSTNERFCTWLERSSSDLDMMTTQTAHGPYPYAGVPWFSTPFGRDGIITATETLWVDPELARGVLRFLADTQATEVDPEHDAEPGKIIHELRLGEMAALGEIPFGRYYGSIDATPLFVILAAEYWRRTADLDAVEVLWPHVLRALTWLEEFGDVDGDGFIEYVPSSGRGLIAQGWKDSHDAISHADGTLVQGPVAVCEAQGYAYAARLAAAELAHVLRDDEVAHALESSAEALRRRFEQTFWSERLGTYVLALDGDKRPCEVRASNAGHLLWSGIVTPERAARVVETLFATTTFTGWGLRTLDATASRFNPISYHNGSVWPHDNAVIAMGLARYGFKAECSDLLAALFEASHYFDLNRTPELFCGFPRRPSQGPTTYPVACAPQAWAAGAVFWLLQACLGLSIDAPRRRILLDRPRLPPSLPEIIIRDLQVAGARVDLACRRRGDDVSLQLLNREGHVEVATTK